MGPAGSRLPRHSRHEHAQRGQTGLQGGCFGSCHFVKVPHLCLPGGDLLAGHVTAGVFGQVVTAHEAPVADGAHKLLLAGVRPPVP